MSASGHTGFTGNGVTNPFTWSHQRGVGGGGLSDREVAEVTSGVLLRPVVLTRKISGCKANQLNRERWQASATALACTEALASGTFIVWNTPTVGDLVHHTQRQGVSYSRQAVCKVRVSSSVALAQTNMEACTSVQLSTLQL
jgi:hypothetical protein